MFAHANFVISARADEHYMKNIKKIEMNKDIAEKTIEQKLAIIENLGFKDDLQTQIDEAEVDIVYYEERKAEIDTVRKNL